MTLDTIDSQNRLSLAATPEEMLAVADNFATHQELATFASQWARSRPAKISNVLRGQQLLRRFTNRKTAVSRLCAALPSLHTSSDRSPQQVGARRKRAPKPPDPAPHENAKAAQTLALLRQPGAANLQRDFHGKPCAQDRGVSTRYELAAEGARRHPSPLRPRPRNISLRLRLRYRILPERLEHSAKLLSILRPQRVHDQRYPSLDACRLEHALRGRRNKRYRREHAGKLGIRRLLERLNVHGDPRINIWEYPDAPRELRNLYTGNVKPHWLIHVPADLLADFEELCEQSAIARVDVEDKGVVFLYPEI